MNRFGVSLLPLLWIGEDESICVGFIPTTSLVVDPMFFIFTARYEPHNKELLLEILLAPMLSTPTELQLTFELFVMPPFYLNFLPLTHYEKFHLLLPSISTFWFICLTHEAFQNMPS